MFELSQIAWSPMNFIKPYVTKDHAILAQVCEFGLAEFGGLPAFYGHDSCGGTFSTMALRSYLHCITSVSRPITTPSSESDAGPWTIYLGEVF